MRLGRYFNTMGEFWLKLQTTHDLTRVQAEVGAETERRVRPRAAEDHLHESRLRMVLTGKFEG